MTPSDASDETGDDGPARLLLFTDGACRGNPGPAGCGVVIKVDGNRRPQHHHHRKKKNTADPNDGADGARSPVLVEFGRKVRTADAHLRRSFFNRLATERTRARQTPPDGGGGVARLQINVSYSIVINRTVCRRCGTCITERRGPVDGSAAPRTTSPSTSRSSTASAPARGSSRRPPPPIPAPRGTRTTWRGGR